MKKKGMNAFLLSRRAKKLLLTMKLTFLMVVIGLLPVSATVYSQATKFSFKAENKRVIEVLKEIEETSNFRFFYQNEQVNVERRVTLKASNATVEEILDDVFKGQGIGYKVIEDFLILLTPEKQMLEKFGNRAAETQQQQKVVTGKVTDTLKQPLPGVSVVVKGTKLGTVTNFDGEFSFSIPSDAKTLVFSFVGMKPKEVEIAGQRSFVVSLEEENVGLEEVVVVGYGTQKKESVVGAISQIDNQALVRSGVTNVTNAITGKMSGVLTVQQSGEPGANDSEIYIRGLSSWNGSAPLVLVDGIERDFTDLDPNEINTLSVLKDASATAVFGAKGANGVIIVNTKRGALGKPKLDITGSYGVQKATRIPEHIDSYTTMSMYNDALMNGQQFTGLIPQWQLDEYKNPSSPLMALRFPNVNWFDLLSNNYAQVANVNLNLSGGTNFVKYFSSLGYSNEGSFFKAAKDGFYNLNYYYKRINYRANIDFNLTKSTILSFNVGGDTGIRNQPKSVPWYDLYFTSPARFPAYWPEWVLQEVPDPVYPNDSGIR
jgi:TonB-linked SusC/RagA family outer membrane protein